MKIANQLVQPIHVFYGGANLFKADTTSKLGRMAAKALETYAANESDWSVAFGLQPEIVGEVRERVLARLETCPVEDLRIDFEDGYGIRRLRKMGCDALRREYAKRESEHFAVLWYSRRRFSDRHSHAPRALSSLSNSTI